MTNLSSKAVLSITEFCHAYGIGKTLTYSEINSGRLRAIKIGRRTGIPKASADQWLESQPPINRSAPVAA